MKAVNRFKLLSIVLVFAYLLSACSGAATQSAAPSGSGKPQGKEVAFTGIVEAIGAGEITVSGQVVALDARSVLDPNIKVGDIVKVEASVSDTGAVIALKVESSVADDTTAGQGNTNDNNTNADNTNADNTNGTNTNANDNSTPANDNTAVNDNGSVVGGTGQEISGVVDAISADAVTIDGVTYQFGSFTELKDAIFVGDTVKLHVIVNADGSLTVREIEKSAGAGIGDDNSNDDNSNSNVNDDNGNDDNSNGSNSNDDNGNDDHDDDNSNSNSNGNSNGSDD